MTSDGISTEDWDEIHELVLAVVNAGQNEDEPMQRIALENLFGALDHLENVYGRLPSLLATKADFTFGPGDPMPLWEEAYMIAGSLRDLKNQLFITSSAASHLMILEKYDEALEWISNGERLLISFFDEGEAADFREMKAKIEQVRQMRNRGEN